MPKFRKKPVVIEAEQVPPEWSDLHPGTPGNTFRATSKTGETFCGFDVLEDKHGWFIFIQALEGQMRANPGDWIITGVQGEKYPCKPDIFEATYEPAGEDKP